MNSCEGERGSQESFGSGTRIFNKVQVNVEEGDKEDGSSSRTARNSGDTTVSSSTSLSS